MNFGMFTILLTLFLFAPLFFTAAELEQPEPIKVEWEVTEILVRVYWMNGRAIRTTWNEHNPYNQSVAAEEVLYAFSECDDAADWGGSYTECDIYTPFPKYVDDETVCRIGHEMMHGFVGEYHGDQ